MSNQNEDRMKYDPISVTTTRELSNHKCQQDVNNLQRRPAGSIPIENYHKNFDSRHQQHLLDAPKLNANIAVHWLKQEGQDMGRNLSPAHIEYTHTRPQRLNTHLIFLVIPDAPYKILQVLVQDPVQASLDFLKRHCRSVKVPVC